METAISYGLIEDVRPVPHFDGTDKFCLRILLPEGSVLLQVLSFLIDRKDNPHFTISMFYIAV